MPKDRKANERDGVRGRKGTTKNLGRKDAHDRFYTKPEEASRLLDALSRTLWNGAIPDDVVFAEPSAGDGAFVLALERAGVPSSRIAAADLVPSRSPLCKAPVFKCDFLSVDNGPAEDGSASEESASSGGAEEKTFACFEDVIEHQTGAEATADRSRIVVIGNPPFGEQGALCLAFLARAFQVADTVAFILPPSFSKESMKKKAGRAVVAEIPVADQEYRVGDGVRDVPSTFFIYDARSEHVPRASRIDELPFEFLSASSDAAESDADFTIRRVGGSAGRASLDTSVSRQSNYFCRVKKGAADETPLSDGKRCGEAAALSGNGATPERMVELINSLEFPERDKTVGPRSLSKDEIAWTMMERIDDENG